MEQQYASGALLTVSLVLLLSQLSVHNKQLVHLFFALFCGSTAMAAIKHLSANSVGSYQFLIGLGACATCNGYWLVSRALFRGEASVTIVHLLFAASVALLVVGNESLNFTQAHYGADSSAINSSQMIIAELLNLLSSSMLVLTAWEGLRTIRVCGVEERIQRSLFLLAWVGAVLTCITFENHTAGQEQHSQIWLMAICAISIMLMTQGLILWRYHPNTFRRCIRSETEITPPTAKDANGDKSNRAEADSELAEAVKRALINQKLFLQANLTVGDLARKLAVPEYKISRVMRQHFDAQNFNQCINALRIQHATQLLEDPNHQHWPVLSIGLESGFASSGPFTRAFKVVHGCTPNVYRSKAMGDPSLSVIGQGPCTN